MPAYGKISREMRGNMSVNPVVARSQVITSSTLEGSGSLFSKIQRIVQALFFVFKKVFILFIE